VRYLREKDVLARVPVKRSTLRRWEEKNRFPRRRVLGPRCVGWIEDEVKAWCESRPKRGGGDAAP
jgi:prophage regulatory protein